VRSFIIATLTLYRSKPVKRPADNLQKRLPVQVIVEYRLTPITPRGDVVNRTREFYA